MSFFSENKLPPGLDTATRNHLKNAANGLEGQAAFLETVQAIGKSTPQAQGNGSELLARVAQMKETSTTRSV